MYIKLRLRLPVTKINKFSRALIGNAKEMFFDFQLVFRPTVRF